MPYEGYADPITNDGPRFHSIIPVSELTERVTRAIEASNKAQPLQLWEIEDGVTHKTQTDPYQAQRGSGAQNTNAWVCDPELAPSLGYASTAHQTPGSATPNWPHQDPRAPSRPIPKN